MKNEAVTQGQFENGMADLRSDLRSDMAQMKSELVRWMVGLFLGVLGLTALIVGTLVNALLLSN